MKPEMPVHSLEEEEAMAVLFLSLTTLVFRCSRTSVGDFRPSVSTSRLANLFIFVLLFWNHILTCFSDTPMSFAIRFRSSSVTYFFFEKTPSSISSCLLVYSVLYRDCGEGGSSTKQKGRYPRALCSNGTW